MKTAEIATDLKAKVLVLEEIEKEYAGRSIDNIIQQMKARIKYYEQGQ